MTKVDELFEKESAYSQAKDEMWEVFDKILGINITDTPYDDLKFDSYDDSFELMDCRNDFIITPEQEKKFYELGFYRFWINYCNGTERAYDKNSAAGGVLKDMRGNKINA